jgi:hypothetical protein
MVQYEYFVMRALCVDVDVDVDVDVGIDLTSAVLVY